MYDTATKCSLTSLIISKALLGGVALCLSVLYSLLIGRIRPSLHAEVSSAANQNNLLGKYYIGFLLLISFRIFELLSFIKKYI